MSPDDILAANLWPWPDPLLKRDRQGNLIFVNAAFLQLYGGRVEDWFGRGVSGWPEPNSQGPQRFETRAGDAPNQTVYDWVETVMADGNTMAIARNVTMFITPPTKPTTKVMPPDKVVTPPANILAQPVTSPAAAATALQNVAAEAPPPQNTQPSLVSDFEDTLNNDADDYRYESSPQVPVNTDTEPAPLTAAPEPAPAPAPVQQEQPEERRMIERRALPIEDSTNVLGSNWRDQVIAKAMEGDGQDETVDNTPQKTPIQDTHEATEITETKPGEGLHILLAEDNAINALLTRTLLEAEGAIVQTVEDGSLAVDAVQKNEYDLIFMDMRMPVMDGLESTRKIRALGKTMPIIALTANAFDDDRNSSFDSGMNDFMTKPVSAEELSEMVATWVKNTTEKEKLAS